MRLPVLLLLLLAGLLAAGCSGPARSLDADAGEIARLEAELRANPGNAEALRDLGVIYMQAQKYPRGYEYLRDAFARGANDPETLYYLGLANELLNKPQTALSLYEQYDEVPRSSPYRRLMRGRYELLSRHLARLEMQARLAAPDTLAAVTPSPDIIAVYPLQYVGSDERYAALSRGLAEMISADLLQVPGLRVVERARVQYLLDEMALGASAYMDPSTTPRTGRLLGAGRLVGGTFALDGTREARLNVALSRLETGTVESLPSQSGPLNTLLDLQKQVVFALLDQLGIVLTPAQRERIQRVPTANLEAFLAYSRGLEREDAGDIEGAQSFYRQAVDLDPAFQAAVNQLEEVEALATAGTPEAALTDLISTGQPGPIDPMTDRLDRLGTYLDAQFFPGPDSRQPATEATTRLPLPPRPPTRPPSGN